MTETTIALITGANKGIGLATARRLAGYGWTVLLGARDPERGTAAAAALAEDGLAVEVLALDVTSDDSVAAAVKQVEYTHGRLDVLVNNAGIVGSRVGPLETGADEMRLCYETNVFGPVRVTRAFLPLLRRSPNPQGRHGVQRIGLSGRHQRAGPPGVHRQRAALPFLEDRS